MAHPNETTSTATIERPGAAPVDIPITPMIKPETAAVEPETGRVMGLNLTRDQIELLKRTVAKGATDDELDMFLYVCRRTGLDPFTKQIHAMKRRIKDGSRWRDQITWQTGIDGLRLIAQRTGEYEGQTEPEWCGADGIWKQVWTDQDPPVAARSGVYRRGFRTALYAVAHYEEYVQVMDVYEGEGEQRSKTGEQVPNRMWSQMPRNQLNKCSESLALRKAFPQELSGIYSYEEMGQARNDQPDDDDDREDPARDRAPNGATGQPRPSQAKTKAPRPDPNAPRFPFPPFTNVLITDPRIGSEMLARAWKWLVDGGAERAKKYPGLEAALLDRAIVNIAGATDDDLTQLLRFVQNPKYAAKLVAFGEAIEAELVRRSEDDETGNGEDIGNASTPRSAPDAAPPTSLGDIPT